MRIWKWSRSTSPNWLAYVARTLGPRCPGFGSCEGFPRSARAGGESSNNERIQKTEWRRSRFATPGDPFPDIGPFLRISHILGRFIFSADRYWWKKSIPCFPMRLSGGFSLYASVYVVSSSARLRSRAQSNWTTITLEGMPLASCRFSCVFLSDDLKTGYSVRWCKPF